MEMRSISKLLIQMGNFIMFSIAIGQNTHCGLLIKFNVFMEMLMTVIEKEVQFYVFTQIIMVI